MGIFCLGVFRRTYNVLFVILLKQTIQNPNPRDATLSSLSNFFTAKIQNGAVEITEIRFSPISSPKIDIEI